MTQNLQSGAHLDADEFSMFVDGTARAHERERMLAHLGQCAECRRVVFMMQSPPEPEATTFVSEKRWRWRWALPVGLAGAALACGLVLAIYLSRHRNPGEILGQNARVQAPAASTADNPGSPKETVRARSDSGSTATSSKETKPQRSATGKPVETPRRTETAPTSRKTTENATGPGEVAGVPPVADEKAGGAEAARPPAAAPQPQVAEAPLAGKAAAESQSITAAKSLPPLRIEHDRGPDDGMSEVTGRVSDMSGAVVPGAQISLRDNTGTTRETTSSGDGTFSLAGVPPGHYELTVTERGFQTSRQTMDLKPRDLAMLDSVLTVGAAAETVTVQSEALTLDTESASVSAIPIAPLPSHVPVAKSAALGKRVLSLDEAGTLFVSRNGGKSWKKVKPQWTGRLAQIEVTTSGAIEEVSKRKKRNAGAENAPARFRLTTDSGAVWTSADGAHWRAQ